MDTLIYFNSLLNRLVWGPWLLVLLLGTGIYFAILLGFPQLRYFIRMFREVLGRRIPKVNTKGSVSSLAALATALSSTVGTGNIAGVATALHLGGPGALFWMLVSSFFGMSVKFAEIILAVHYREKDGYGNWRGGTMYILEKVTGQKWLAWLFAFFTMFAALGIGNAIQANSTAEGLKMGFGIPHLFTGITMAVLTTFVILGGIKSISRIATFLVPFMALFYIASTLVVIILNIDVLPGAIKTIIWQAFHTSTAASGGLAGWTVKQALTKGVARGLFSNEAGMGSTPMAHATAIVDHPVRQGMYGLFEVFADTIVLCTLTALAVIVSGTLTANGHLTGAQLTMSSFQGVLGDWGVAMLLIGLALFAFSTVLGWYWYGETGATYIFGPKVIPFYKVLWIVVIVIGAWGGGGQFLENLWSLSDTMNGLMAVPNLIALLCASWQVRRLVKEFDGLERDHG
ncbi:MAG: alanine/glycine:cation symporter family protein [Chlamydiota bacterium]